ncbi:MAG: hypothetical protein ABJA67_15525 [Chthonomonadales bacterium]
MYLFCILCSLIWPSGNIGQVRQLSADQIITKCLAAYDSAKTYQATVSMHINYPTQKVTMKIKMRSVSDGAGKIRQSAGSSSTRIVRKGMPQNEDRVLVDDGTIVYSIDPSTKSYTSMPHAPDSVSGIFRNTFERMTKSCSKFSVSIINDKGKEKYKILGFAKDGITTVLISKDNFQLYSLHTVRDSGPNKGTADLVVSDQVFNQAIDQKAFRWSPPPGYIKSESEKPLIGNARQKP